MKTYLGRCPSCRGVIGMANDNTIMACRPRWRKMGLDVEKLAAFSSSTEHLGHSPDCEKNETIRLDLPAGAAVTGAIFVDPDRVYGDPEVCAVRLASGSEVVADVSMGRWAVVARDQDGLELGWTFARGPDDAAEIVEAWARRYS